MENLVSMQIKNETVYATPEQAKVLNTLLAAKAGFVGIKGYTSESGYVTGRPKIADIVINGKVSSAKLAKNRLAAMQALKFEDIDASKWIAGKGKNAFDDAKAQFEFCKQAMIKSAQGNGSASHKKAHADHSISLHSGIKVWLDEPNAQGLRTIKSVLINGIVHHENVIEKGERKTVNSGSKVLMDKIIERSLKCNEQHRTYNLLKAKSVKISGMEL